MTGSKIMYALAEINFILLTKESCYDQLNSLNHTITIT